MENVVSITVPSNHIKSTSRLLLLTGLALGYAVDLLFYGKMLGVSVPIFVFLSLGALFWLGRVEHVKPAMRNLWIVVPLLYFALMVAIRANNRLTMLNVCMVLILLAYMAYFYAAGRIGETGFLGHIAAFVQTAAASIFKTPALLAESANMEMVRGVGIRRLLPVARGLLFAIPLLLLFAALLASADLVFARYMSSLFRIEFLTNIQESLGHLLVVLVSSWLLAGGLAYALSRSYGDGDIAVSERGTVGDRHSLSIGFVEAVTVMVLVSALFLLFGWIQFAYLFGGETNITSEGHTYADYARRGFFELVAISVMTLALILGLRYLSPLATSRERWTFNTLSTFVIGLVMVLLASAYWRMLLYEEAYGYTHLRLYVQLFEIWLAITFVWLLVTLWAPKMRFGIGGFIAILGFAATLNLANPDALIATENVARWEATGKVDIDYLTHLSEDAVPVLVQALDGKMGYQQEILRRTLLDRLRNMEANPGWREWQSFHFARQGAYDALVQHRVSLER
ncbi:MAG TPA: DUF4173 domain-containing protein [Chloroflexia bacterium]|nr:DUF4173 domain-containing protein [Chloroflexia bacterium]